MAEYKEYVDNEGRRAPIVMSAAMLSHGLDSLVTITIPWDLIHLAKTYPAIDWNVVLKRAIAIAEKEGRK